MRLGPAAAGGPGCESRSKAVNRKVLLLNLALLGLIGLLVWQLRMRRQTAEGHERAVLLKDGQGRALLAPPSPAPVPPVAPAEYIESVQKMLFSKDRNPNVIVDPPPPPAPVKPAPPPPPMPPLPRYYGQFHFGGPPVVILSSATDNDQKHYEVGDKIGDFKVLAFDQETITLDWDGKQVVRDLADLSPKGAQQPGNSSRRIRATAHSSPRRSAPVTVVIGGRTIRQQRLRRPSETTWEEASTLARIRTMTSPSGTVVDGYRKVINQGLMGKSCRWEKVQ